MYYYDGVREEQLEPVTRKGPWTAEEDRLLVNYVGAHGVAITWDILARDAEATHEDYGIVVPQEDTRSLNNSQGYNPHGGGGGEGSCDGAAMDVPPGILALSGENLWSFEDFWPMEMEQSFHSNSSAQFFEHEAI
ncbi:hypothetical protein EJB05_36487, partial [Eragrostis curvula]